MNAREWLRANGYDNVADLIGEVIEEWQATGNRTRRNWWDVLAGRKDGKPCTIAGREFPILRVAQIRQGRPVTEKAISNNPDEEAPPVVVSGRWQKQEG